MDSDYLRARYGFSMSDTDMSNQVQSMRVTVHARSDVSDKSDVFLFPTVNKDVLLVAVLVEGYYLGLTHDPVSVEMIHTFNGEQTCIVPEVTYKNRKVNDVLFPATDNLSNKVWFKVDTRSLNIFKEYGYKLDDYQEGLIIQEERKVRTVFFSITKKTKSVDSPPYCPMGFVMHDLKAKGNKTFADLVLTKTGDASGNTHDGYRLAESEWLTLLNRVSTILNENRPKVNLSTLQLRVKGESAPFSMAATLDIYFNDVES